MPSIDTQLPSNVDTQVLLLKFPNSMANSERTACIIPLTTTQYMGALRGKDLNIIASFESDLLSEAEQPIEGKVIVSIAQEVKDSIKMAVGGVRQVLRITPISEINPEMQIFSDTLT